VSSDGRLEPEHAARTTTHVMTATAARRVGHALTSGLAGVEQPGQGLVQLGPGSSPAAKSPLDIGDRAFEHVEPVA